MHVCSGCTLDPVVLFPCPDCDASYCDYCIVATLKTECERCGYKHMDEKPTPSLWDVKLGGRVIMGTQFESSETTETTESSERVDSPEYTAVPIYPPYAYIVYAALNDLAMEIEGAFPQMFQ